MLKEEGIPFQKEKTVGRCHADVFIEPNILIELNGDYWHGCPKHFPKPNKMQKTAMAKDARRYYFFNKLGFKLEVIWEHELEEPEKVRARLRKLYQSTKE
jgi:G:T-mismatch repair DNA endonuclease (very short patch repair protein)